MTKPRSLLLISVAVAMLQFPFAAGQQGAQTTDAQAELGRMIFHDSRVASDNTTSCATCHQEARAWSDGRPLAVGRVGNQQTPNGRVGIRKTPSIINSVLTQQQFRDLRAVSPLAQATMPMENPAEMGDQTVGQVAARLSSIAGYRTLTQAAFGTPQLNRDRMAIALVAFQRKYLVATDTPLARYIADRDDHGMSASAVRGAELFLDLGCIDCHPSPTFTTGKAANTGVAYYFAGGDLNRADTGLAKTTGRQQDFRAFKIPSLVGVGLRANQPMGHAGQFKNLEQVLSHYNNGGQFNRGNKREADPLIDSRIKRLDLEYEPFQDLKACLLEGTIPLDLPKGVVPTVAELPR